jgi:hypothetical protein
MNRQLYAKSLDAQEGLLLSVLEDVTEQLLKRVNSSIRLCFLIALAPIATGVVSTRHAL